MSIGMSVVLMISAVALVLLSLLQLFRLLSMRRAPKANILEFEKLPTMVKKHHVVSSFIAVVKEDGAGEWPPKVTHTGWPLPLRPYRDILREMTAHLSTDDVSLDDETNIQRIDHFRQDMRILLSEKVNIYDVRSVLSRIESGSWDIFPRDEYNGFYCCLAFLRHAYRWAIIPIVKVAQREAVVDFPAELDVPWGYLQRNFGVTSDSGNAMSNIILNCDRQGKPLYKINESMSENIRKSEDNFHSMFRSTEHLAVLVYYAMVYAVIEFENKDRQSCLKHLEAISTALRRLFRNFYKGMQDCHIAHSVWMQYVQGFHAWGAGKMDGQQFVNYDGVSGGHVLAFQAIDAFLGLGQLFGDDYTRLYVSTNQRQFCSALREYGFRNKLGDSAEDLVLKAQFDGIAKQMRVFRAAHQKRAMPYLEVAAPERLPMTAGSSVLKESDSHCGNKEPLEQIRAFLDARMKQTR